MAAPHTELEAVLGHTFSDRALLRRALTHSSVARNAAERLETNERLEFLGDRVLGLVVAEMLFARFPEEEEGALARRHAHLVCRPALARVAAGIDLGTYVALGRSEEDGGGRESPALQANACEALIAALYLDGGMEAAGHFIRTHWAALMEEDPRPPKDAKTTLQEWAQARGLALPAYTVIAREGPDHAPQFTIEARLDGHPPVTAEGASKRAAEQAAAAALLETLDKEGGA